MSAADFSLRPLSETDYQAALALWQACEGVGLRPSDADSQKQLTRFVRRNPTTCFAAECDGRMMGTVLAGEDGRRGYLYHLAVLPEYRGRGYGRILATEALNALRQRGIDKCHIHVFQNNHAARKFWRAVGWHERQDLMAMSIVLVDEPST